MMNDIPDPSRVAFLRPTTFDLRLSIFIRVFVFVFKFLNLSGLTYNKLLVEIVTFCRVDVNGRLGYTVY